MQYVGMLKNDIVEIDIVVCEKCGCWFGLYYGFVESGSVDCVCPYCRFSSWIIDTPEDDIFITSFEEIDTICARYDGR